MGKLYLGILGGFSGTVGTVVGSTNKNGDDIIRARSKKNRSAASAEQVKQQTKFGLVTSFLSPLTGVLNLGLGAVSNGMSAFNYATQRALTQAVKGGYPNHELDYAKVILSQGGLGMAASATATMADGKINFSWTDNPGLHASLTDRAVLVVYNVDNQELAVSVSDFTRESRAGEILLPYCSAGDGLVCYLFFQSVDEPLKVSGSQYLGSFTV